MSLGEGPRTPGNKTPSFDILASKTIGPKGKLPLEEHAGHRLCLDAQEQQRNGFTDKHLYKFSMTAVAFLQIQQFSQAILRPWLCCSTSDSSTDEM